MRILVFEGDLRQMYLAKHLEKMKYAVGILHKDEIMGEREKDAAECLRDKVRAHEVIVLPTPSFTKEGMIRGTDLSFDTLAEMVQEGQMIFGSVIGRERTQMLLQKGVKVHDMMASEEVAMRNAVATAEGAIAEAIGLTDGNLHEMSALVIGYGRCGSVLAQKLKGLCGEVCVTARRKEVRTQAESMGFRAILLEEWIGDDFDIIFNTVPAPVLGKKEIGTLKSDCVIIDLASAPGGVDYEACADAGIKAKLCSALPGKYAPKTSGVILAEEIERSIICRN